MLKMLQIERLAHGGPEAAGRRRRLVNTNLVEIDIRTNDQTDFAAVLAKAEALKKALNGNGLLGFNPQASTPSCPR